MKKLLLLLVASLTMLFAGCTQFDDTRIWDAIDELEDLFKDLDDRVEDLEEACEKMNTNIEALQTLVSALQNNDTITSIAPIKQGDKVVGYTITFSKSEPITIYHGNDGKNGANGADGQNGANGADGKDGKDGYTPQIGVAKDSDNVYYWTLDGEWLLDESGNKIKAVGTDGKDGENGEDGANGNDGSNGEDGKDGEDGITPQLEIREGYWWISYDNGATWKELGKATGEDGIDGVDGEDGANGSDGQDGKDGADGDSLFESVTWDEEYAYFTLTDGTTIKIPLSEGAVTKNIEVTAVGLLGFQDHGMLVIGLSDVGFSVDNDGEDGSVILLNSRNYILTLTLDINDYSVVPQGTFTTEAGDFETRDGCYCMFVGEDDQESFNIREAVVVVSEGRIEATLTLDNGEVHHVVYEGSLKIGERIEDDPDVPNTEIYYTSTDGKIVGPSSDAFGVNILSNTYEDGKGVIIIDGDAVEIGEDAFSGCSNLASLIIPEGVTSIGAWAFNACENLTSINIPDGITSIEQSTFRYCSSLTSINIPDGVTEIGDRAFEDCSRLASLTIPEGVTSIGQHAFYYCCSLTSITIPESVVSIKYGAFQCCSSLTEVYCKPTTPPSGGSYMFHNETFALECTIYVPTESVGAYNSASYWSYYADAIVGYDFENGGSGEDTTAPPANEIWYTSTDGEIVEVVECSAYGVTIISNTYENGKGVIVSDCDVASIDDGVDFMGCLNLASITLPDGITSIGRSAFSGCSSLTSINIPDSVTSIGSSAFRGCSSLTSITIPDSVTTIGNYAFQECSSLTSITIPDSVTSIGEMAFYGCSSLTEVHISNIAAWCGISFGCSDANPLYNAHNLYLNGELVTDLVIPDGVTSISGYAFEGCSNLASVTIPDNVTSIGEWAFYCCSSLASITIPDSVTSIGDGAFSECI